MKFNEISSLCVFQCSPIAGYKFSRGAYKCACRQGYEYPFKDGRNFFQGSLVDIEYEKKMAGLFSLWVYVKSWQYLKGEDICFS